ncbi:MAG: hypothetical protein JNK02_17455 [Planctomycetes bacterium]|nr:hypothetical protein [Planctomycetota bacterium]
MRRLTPILLLPALAAASAAQAPVVLVKDADVVAGVGNVTAIDNLAVNAAGTWLVEADTDNPNTAIDGVILKNGVVALRQGDLLAAPAGASVSSFDAVTINAAGDSGWNLFLAGVPTSADSGIYFNSTLVLQEGALSTSPSFSPGTPYIGFFETKFNDLGQILVVASVDDVAIATTVDRALVLLQVDGSGTLLSETVLLKEGDSIAGIPVETVADIAQGPHDFALNNGGVAMYTVDLTGSTTTDGLVIVGSTVVAREGDPSAVPGRNYEILYDRHVDLADSGDYVFLANLDGATTDDDVIIKNGTTVIAREGFGLAAIGAFTITSFGTGPVRIDSSGNVFWFGDWNDPDTTRDTGLFRNGELLVQEGVTLTSGGALIVSIASVQDSFAISPDGRWLIFEGQLAGGVDAAFLLDVFGSAVPFCFGDGSGTPCPCGNVGGPANGCASSVNAAGANLAASGITSLSADSLVLAGSGMPNSSALYFQGTTQLAGGLGAVFGDGLRCAGGTVIRLGTKSNVAGASLYPAGGDPAVSVRGLVGAPGLRTYQVWYRNAAAFCTSDTFNLTNGIAVTWSP